MICDMYWYVSVFMHIFSRQFPIEIDLPKPTKLSRREKKTKHSSVDVRNCRILSVDVSDPFPAYQPQPHPNVIREKKFSNIQNHKSCRFIRRWKPKKVTSLFIIVCLNTFKGRNSILNTDNNFTAVIYIYTYIPWKSTNIFYSLVYKPSFL